MKPLNCIALDDEPLALKVLNHYIQQMPALNPLGFYTDPQQARQRILEQSIDLLFLDIQMPDISGLQFFSTLPQPPMVIFSTAFREFAVEGFELDAIDYIVKPYEFKRFEKAVNKAIEYHRFLNASSNNTTTESDQYIFVKSSYSVIKVSLEDLLYVETYDDYLKLHLKTEKRPLLTLMTLRRMEESLPHPRFLRVHRSYLVAVEQVERIRGNKLYVKGQEIPIGVTYQDSVKTHFK